MARIVIALGGNALGNTAAEQREMISRAAPSLIGLIRQGHEIIVTHGNGPQVGVIQLAFEDAFEKGVLPAAMPLPECTAMSQGYIGYHLQKGLLEQLRREGMPWHVATVVTQMVVDPRDAAFQNPTKPIGAFYSREEMEALRKENPQWVFQEDSGRGFRRVVASPKPLDIVEKDSILNLLDHEFVVIACGGGGIPVVKKDEDDYEGVDGVIDKDLAAAKLADLVEADRLFILTAVDKVCLSYNTPQARELDEMTLKEAELYTSQGQFAAGSMLPKVEAAVSFVKGKPGRLATIGSLEQAPLAMEGKAGTLIRE